MRRSSGKLFLAIILGLLPGCTADRYSRQGSDQWIVATARMKPETPAAVPWKGIMIGSTSRRQLDEQFGPGRQADAHSTAYVIDGISVSVNFTQQGVADAIRMSPATEVTRDQIVGDYGLPDHDVKNAGYDTMVYESAGLTVEFAPHQLYAQSVELRAPLRLPDDKDRRMVAALLPIRPPLGDLEGRRAQVQNALDEAGGGLNVLTSEQERAIGGEVYGAVARNGEILNDEDLQLYLVGLVDRLASVTPGASDQTWRVSMTGGTAANAMSAGGGYIFINRGCLDKLNNEAQFALVVAHEMAHQMKRHAAVTETRALIPMILVEGGAIAASIKAGPQAGRTAEELGQMAVEAGLAPFTRAQERDADRIAITMLYSAGYDPREAVKVFERMKSEQAKRGGSITIISSHPIPDARIEAAREWLATYGPGISPNSIVTTRDYATIRATYRGNRWD